MLKKKTQKSFPNCFLSEAKCAVQGDERNQVHMRIEIPEQRILELTSHYIVSLDERNQVHTRIKIPERHM